jgi:SAM-dependent methyltransferase
VSGATVTDFIGYWQEEGLAYARRGDYDWMAMLTPGNRVLDVGCGVGFGTLALARRGLNVLAVDSLSECLASTREQFAADDRPVCTLLQADLTVDDPALQQQIAEFAPDTVVCWLMGAPAETTGALPSDAGQAVAAYREKLHRRVAELATALPSVRALHLVDRTAIPWQAKDLGRETLVRYHLGKTLVDLPFSAQKGDALYRRLEDKVVDLSEIRRSHPALKSVVPALASLVAYRK